MNPHTHNGHAGEWGCRGGGGSRISWKFYDRNAIPEVVPNACTSRLGITEQPLAPSLRSRTWPCFYDFKGTALKTKWFKATSVVFCMGQPPFTNNHLAGRLSYADHLEDEQENARRNREAGWRAQQRARARAEKNEASENKS